MVLTIDGKKGEAEKLKCAIAEKVGSQNVSTLGQKKKTLHILDIDVITTKSEIEKAVAKAISIKNEEAMVSSVRPTYGENQIATVILYAEKADELIKLGTIPIGWIQCGVKERTEVKRCYRCQEFGHVIRNCKGQSRENMCLRCGGEGHKAGECQEEESCWVCKTKGHRGGTTKYPEYRKLIGNAAKNKRRNAEHPAN